MPDDPEKPPRRGLSVYQLQPGFEEPAVALREFTRLTRLTLRLRGATQCTLWVHRSRLRTPSWASLFQDVVDPDIFGKAAGVSAVLLLTVGEARFAVVFGYGRYLLDPSAFDERFGLRVTLNAVDPAQLRTIDKDTFENVARHTREQVSKSTTIMGFGINIDQDLIRAVEGVPSDADLGMRLAGRDALHATVTIGLADLPALLARFGRLSKDVAYLKQYPWIDNIKDVRSPTVIDNLNGQLVALLGARTLGRAWLTPPVVTDWPAGGYRYGRGSRERDVQELRLGEFLDHLFADQGPTARALKAQHVLPLAGDDSPKDRWTAYQCLYAEIQSEDRVYLLSAGHWYEIDKDFVDSVNSYVTAIPFTTLALPECGRESEKEYNVRVSRTSGGRVANLDRIIIFHGGGKSQVEACDLYTRDRQFVHVKHYDNSSSVLSHLFSQARISAELFLQDAEFRRKFNAKLPRAFRIGNAEVRPASGDFEIVLAIISRSASPSLLPFFSRVNLRQTHRALAAYGYRVTVANIRKLAATTTQPV